MEHFRQGYGVHRSLPVLLGQIDHSGPESHLDLDEGLVAVGQQIFRLPGVDADDAEEQVAGRAQGHLHLGLQDAVHRFLDVGLEYVRFGELLVPVGGEPYSGQGALLGQDEVRVEHFGGFLEFFGLMQRFRWVWRLKWFVVGICVTHLFLQVV